MGNGNKTLKYFCALAIGDNLLQIFGTATLNVTHFADHQALSQEIRFIVATVVVSSSASLLCLIICGYTYLKYKKKTIHEDSKSIKFS